MARLHECLANLKADMTVSDFLNQHFAGPECRRLRHFVVRVEGYDAADPARASTLALRDEWMDSSESVLARIVGGYGALIEYLTADCREKGTKIHLSSVVSAIEMIDEQAVVHCVNGDAYAAEAVVLTVPLPVLNEIALPPDAREKASAVADIGFGNVIKLLLRFNTHWWRSGKGRDLSDLLFFISDERIPVWWRSSRPSIPCSPAGSPVPVRNAWPNSTRKS
jgi:monoamine oxidase